MADEVHDPRRRNRLFDTGSAAAYLRDYADGLRDALHGVDGAALERARALIAGAADAGRRVFAIGNGGSSAIADHLCCDLTKGTHTHHHPTVDTTSLSATTALYSAIANDFGFETVFARQVEMIGREGDVLIAISSSGNSPNILNAVTAAQARGMTVIGLSGFSGGGLRTAADVALHVDVANYGVVEDAHQALMHIIAQLIAAARDGNAAA